MIIFHVPHSSIKIPDKYRDQFVLSDKELHEEALIMADLFTDKLVELFDEEKIIFPLSRIVCDVERFRDDSKEEMSKQGMGVVYTNCHNLKPLRKKGVDAEKIKSELYDKHHLIFESKVNESLKKTGTCLIVDVHSYSENALPYELHQNDKRPDICLGFEEYHFDRKLLNKIKSACTNAGYSVSENEPFKGSIVPLSMYKKDSRVKSLMIEINKRNYLNGFSVNKAKFEQLQLLMQKIVELIKES